MPTKKKPTKSAVKSTKSMNCCTNCDPSTHPLNRVTSFSKILAAVLFITLPFLFFVVGAHFQRSVDREICGPTVDYSVDLPF